jgi:hypothetical protein
VKYNEDVSLGHWANGIRMAHRAGRPSTAWARRGQKPQPTWYGPGLRPRGLRQGRRNEDQEAVCRATGREARHGPSRRGKVREARGRQVGGEALRWCGCTPGSDIAPTCLHVFMARLMLGEAGAGERVVPAIWENLGAAGTPDEKSDCGHAGRPKQRRAKTELRIKESEEGRSRHCVQQQRSWSAGTQVKAGPGTQALEGGRGGN